MHQTYIGAVDAAEARSDARAVDVQARLDEKTVALDAMAVQAAALQEQLKEKEAAVKEVKDQVDMLEVRQPCS